MNEIVCEDDSLALHLAAASTLSESLINALTPSQAEALLRALDAGAELRVETTIVPRPGVRLVVDRSGHVVELARLPDHFDA